MLYHTGTINFMTMLDMEVSQNRDTPKSSIFDRIFQEINQPAVGGTPISAEAQLILQLLGTALIRTPPCAAKCGWASPW